MNDNDDASIDHSPGLAYIAEHEEISNVLLTGGDPLMMSTSRLERIFDDLASVPQVRVIRLGSKMVAFNPFRVLDDFGLLALIRALCESGTQIYIVNHFDHPKELTPEAREALGLLLRAGAQIVNQCPIIRGVNDNPHTLASLFRELSFVGCPPYYVFQCRPTSGNEPYTVPIIEGHHIFTEANRHISGLAKRARFVMSHRTGKIEICGTNDSLIYMRYHRAHLPEDYGQMVIALRDDEAYWLDQLTLVSGTQSAIDSAADYVPFYG